MAPATPVRACEALLAVDPFAMVVLILILHEFDAPTGTNSLSLGFPYVAKPPMVVGLGGFPSVVMLALEQSDFCNLFEENRVVMEEVVFEILVDVRAIIFPLASSNKVGQATTLLAEPVYGSTSGL